MSPGMARSADAPRVLLNSTNEACGIIKRKDSDPIWQSAQSGRSQTQQAFASCGELRRGRRRLCVRLLGRVASLDDRRQPNVFVSTHVVEEAVVPLPTPVPQDIGELDGHDEPEAVLPVVADSLADLMHPGDRASRVVLDGEVTKLLELREKLVLRHLSEQLCHVHAPRHRVSHRATKLGLRSKDLPDLVSPGGAGWLECS